VNKRNKLLLAGAMSLLVAGAILNTSIRNNKIDDAIRANSEKEAQIQAHCAVEKAEERIACINNRLPKAIAFNETLKFKIVRTGTKSVELMGQRVEAAKNAFYYKISRPETLSLAQGCVSTFRIFDFDAQFVYVSGDNESGMIICDQGRSVITTRSVSDRDVAKRILSMKKSHLI
jgi:hypothetical protein